MEFSVLGPLAVQRDGDEVRLAASKPRVLLTRLLLDANRAVPADRLIEDLWDGSPPRSAAQTLQSYVSQLRKVLGPDRLVTGAGAYRVVVEEGELDRARFEGLVSRGVAALRSGAAADASETLAGSLALWRGDAFADAAGAPWAAPETARLAELRLVATEGLLEARLALHDEASVILTAEAAVAEHPLRERLWAHLITALYRDGRQADALRAFQRLRHHLADELGIDPSPELRDLERAVLDQDPALGAPMRSGEGVSTAPRSLPSGTVTFLLTDVVGSTRLWDSFPRLMPDALALHDNALREAVEMHGGVVLKSRGEGDSVFAVFRRATEAANAAIAAQQALGSLDWPEGCALTVRMAVHTGEALERDGDYYGPTVNRAARLRSLASGGQVLVSHAAAELIIDHLPAEVRLVVLGPHPLRDLERPETVYLLGDAAAALDDHQPAPTEPTSSSRLEPPPLPSTLTSSIPFVGRTPELYRLDAEWQLALDGTPRVALVGGEPGVGKTRLAAEVARRVYDGGAVVVYGRCDEDLGAPYQPFAEALRALLPAVDADTLRAVRGVEELARLVPEIADMVPDLPPATRGDPETERYVLFDAVARLLVTVSKQRPLLVVLDDLHWATKPTLLLLRHVVRFGEGARFQLLGTYRTTDLDPNHALSATMADLHRDGTTARVVLAGLGESDVNALLEAAGHDDDELAKTLSSVTSGNPFFLIEVLRHVEETGAPWDPNTLPQGVREAVGRRVARLADPTRDALLTGAVAGARFSLPLVEEVLDRDLVDAVAEACDAGLLVEEPDGYLRFNHALVRQSLLNGVASVKRVRLHRRIAEALEATGAGSDDRLADLAHHYFESAWAGTAAKAVHYCRRAADQAMARLAYEGAAELYERAVQALDVDETASDADRAELLLARCEAHLAADDAAGAAVAVADLERLAGDDRVIAAWVLCFRAQLAVLARPDQLDEMERRVASAADEFASLGHAGGEAVAHNTRAACLARLGRFADCELALDRALTAARRSTETSAAAHDRRVNAVLAGAPSAALWGPSPVARAGGRCLDVIRLLRITTRSPVVEATSVRCQAMLEAFRGREQAARRMLDSARRNVAELGLRHASLEIDLYEGMVDLLADDADAAAAHLRRAYDGFTRMGLDADAAEAAALLARACLAVGPGEDADRFCTESERLGGQDLRASIAWRTVRAELHARHGDLELAREVAQAAVVLAERTDALVDQGDAHLALAVVLHAAGDHSAAAAAANDAVARYERKGASALAERARRVAGSPASMTEPMHPERGAAPSSLVPTLVVAHLRVLSDVFTRQAWDELSSAVHPDIAYENRSRTLQPTSRGIEAYTRFLRSVSDVGHGLPRLRFLGSRGERLALVHTSSRVSSGGAEWSDEVLRVLEVAADGRLVRDVVFDVDHLDAAYAELDRRFVDGEGAGHADVLRTVAGAIDAYNRRDAARALLSADLEAVDHRAAAVVAHGGQALVAEFEAAMAQLPDSTLRLAAVHVLGDRGAVVTTVLRGSTPSGTAVEKVFHAVHVVDDESIVRVEIFSDSDLDVAIARFTELTSPEVAGVAPNEAVRLDDELHHAYLRRDWTTVASLVAEDAVYDDRRAGFQLAFRGRDRWIENFEAMAAIGVARLDSIPLATRGECLALFHARGGGEDRGPTAPDVETLNVAAVDARGRFTDMLVFDVDERDAAFAALNDRYLAGEGAPFADTFRTFLGYLDARVRDPEGSLDLVADDVVFVDHRPAGLGHGRGKDDFRRVLSRQAAVRFEVAGVEAIDERLVLTQLHPWGDSPDGVAVEWRLHCLCQFENGLVVRVEFFDAAAGHRARIAFERLRAGLAGAGIAGNTATATWARFHDVCARQDWDALDEVLAGDVLSDDRRSGVQLRVSGRVAVGEVARSLAQIGTAWFERTVLATRGDRHALVRTRAGGRQPDAGSEGEALDVVEVDAEGRHVAGIHFGVSDVDAAFAELDARYLAGEGARWASTVGPALGVIRLRNRDFDGAIALMAKDVTVVDHRPASFGTVQSREGLRLLVSPRWPVEPRVVAIDAVADGAVLLLVDTRGASEESAAVQWLLHELWLVDDGLIRGLEIFDRDGRSAALARFEEVRGPAPASLAPDNTAARVFRRYESACGGQDWATAERLLTADAVADDRRSGSHTRFDGRAAVVDAMRGAAAVGTTSFHHATVATRGDRLALLRVLGTGIGTGPGTPEVEVLDVVECDAHGLLAEVVTFDADALEPAVAELDTRYLRGEGAPLASTLAPALDAVRARWVGRTQVLAVEAVVPGVVLLVAHAAGGASRDGRVERLVRVLCTVHEGLVTRLDLFDQDQRDDAYAEFEAHRRRQVPSVPGNAASRAIAGFLLACARGEWDRARAMGASDIRMDDLRMGVQLRDVDGDGWIATHRIAFNMGVTRIEPRTVATRGDRLVLSHLWCGADADGGAPVVEMLQVVETDERGLIVASVGFDLDAVDAAYAELDRRYVTGEAAPVAATWNAIVEAYGRFNGGRGELRWPAAPVEVTAFAEVPGIEARVVTVHRLTGGAALLGVQATAPDVDSWHWLVVLDVDDGRVRTLETYAPGDIDAALARFEALEAL